MKKNALCTRSTSRPFRKFQRGNIYKIERIRTDKNVYYKVYEDKNNNLEFDIIELDSFKEYFQATDRKL